MILKPLQETLLAKKQVVSRDYSIVFPKDRRFKRSGNSYHQISDAAGTHQLFDVSDCYTKKLHFPIKNFIDLNHYFNEIFVYIN